MDGDNAFWAGIGSLVAGVGAALVAGFLKISGLLHSQNRDKLRWQEAEQKRIISQYETLAKEARQEAHFLRNEMSKLQNIVADYRAELSRAVERIRSLEDIVTRHTDLKINTWGLDDSNSSFDVSSE